MKKYVMEAWNPTTRHYVRVGEWDDFHWAITTFNKPYWRRVTRRLVKVVMTRIILEKGKKVR